MTDVIRHAASAVDMLARELEAAKREIEILKNENKNLREILSDIDDDFRRPDYRFDRYETGREDDGVQ